MRILHLANHCDEVGNGIMNVAVDIACKQADLGHEVLFASGGGSFVDLLIRHNVTHNLIEQPWRRPIRLGLATMRIAHLLRRTRPDIVHAHMMTGAVLAYCCRKWLNFVLITTVHNEWRRSAILMGLGDYVIAVSDNGRSRMRTRGVPERKLCVVRNATLGSPRRSSAEPDSSIKLQRPAVLTVAGMYHRKGIGDLIEAFSRAAFCHPNAHLYLVGDGPDRTTFENQARALAISDRTHFTGFVRDPRPYLAQADIFVLASRNDPSPLVIPEAREAGCAVIGTSVGGIPEALENGRAGLLVPPNDPTALAGAIDRMLSDPEERSHWRLRACDNLEWLHIDRAVSETMAIYQDALTRQGTANCAQRDAPAARG